MNSALDILAAALLFMVPLQMDQLLFALHERRRAKFWLRILVSEVLYLLLAILITALIEKDVITRLSLIMYVGIYLFTYFMMVFCFQIPNIEVIFVTSCGYALQHIGNSISAMCYYGLSNAGKAVISGRVLELIIQLILAAGAYFFLFKKNRFSGERRERDPRMVSIAIVILFSCLFLNTWGVSVSNTLGDSVSIFANMICKIYAVICCSFAIYLEYAVSYMNYMNKQQEFMEQLIQTQGNQLQMSQESVSIINRKCHDIKYQLKALRFMNNTDQRQEYINEIQKAISIYDSVYHTGNEALNLLLREKTLLCEEYGIQFSCMADGSILSFISTDDLYVLLGNALDNAIESVMKEEDQEKRVVSLFIGMKKGMKCIHLENYCREPVTFHDGVPVTSKEDTAYHGFGIQSMQFLADKYHGSMVVKNTHDTFYLNFFFPEQS